MDGENRVTLLGKPEDGGAALVFSGISPVPDDLYRVRGNYAEHVRSGYTLWKDGT